MAENLQEQIRRRVEERDAEGLFVNKSLEDMHGAARGTGLAKRLKGKRTKVFKAAADHAAQAARSVRAGDGRWFREALASDFGHVSEGVAGTLHKQAETDRDSPAVSILGNLNRLLAAFRDAEGHDPTEDDVEYWKAFATIVRQGLGA